MKPVANVFGNIRTVPYVGERVIIFVNGLPHYYTSPVMKIHEQAESMIVFETKNTLYKVKYDKCAKVA